MPYKSEAMRGWAHTPEGMKALGGAAKVAEWDHASKGMSLPAHAAMHKEEKPKKGSIAETFDRLRPR